jgi:hypothetical protein
MLTPVSKPASFSRIRALIDDKTWEHIVARYVWWETPAQAESYAERVLARVMRLGDFWDIEKVAEEVGDDTLRDVVVHAEAGWFDVRAWHYWHYRLGLSDIGAVPPLPRRAYS